MVEQERLKTEVGTLMDMKRTHLFNSIGMM